MSKSHSKNFAVLFTSVLSLCIIGGSIAVAQTKQLKTPEKFQVTENSNEHTQTPTLSNGSSGSSYSVVIENKTTPDGKVVQSRKVWQNGKLITEEEKTLDANDNQNNFDATIQLPNGQVTPGNIFSSDDENDLFGTMSSSPFEAIRQMEEKIRRQHESFMEQFDAIRQQLGDLNPQSSVPQSKIPGSLIPNQSSMSKFWIGASIEQVPSLLVYQLPIEDNQGVLIQYVAPKSPAEKAGLKRYDVLYKINGEIISGPVNVSKLIEDLGQVQIEVEYFRKGKLEKCNLSIEERPVQKDLQFGNSQQKNFRVVRPGLIVPSTVADSVFETEPSQPSTEQQSEGDSNSQESNMNDATSEATQNKNK